jgi:hypothetical protein
MLELENALVLCADALAAVMREQPHAWQTLSSEGAREIAALMQYHDALGVPPELLPPLSLGARIIDLLAERHPQLCTDVPAGST